MQKISNLCLWALNVSNTDLFMQLINKCNIFFFNFVSFLVLKFNIKITCNKLISKNKANWLNKIRWHFKGVIALELLFYQILVLKYSFLHWINLYIMPDKQFRLIYFSWAFSSVKWEITDGDYFLLNGR